jgi:uncharacterized protein YggU (UPF0235/DUF167 family)
MRPTAARPRRISRRISRRKGKATATLRVKVVPRAARSEIAGWLDGALKVRIAAAPEAGRANAALEALLASVLGVRASAVRVTAGHASTRKRVEIDGLDAPEIERRLGVVARR